MPDKPSLTANIAWQQKLRFDYTPEDCKSFAAAIEKVVVPAATRIYQKRKQALGLDTLRPWDLVDGWFSRPAPPADLSQLKPFATIDELKSKTLSHLPPRGPGAGRLLRPHGCRRPDRP